jgi:actinin alpha
LTLHSLKASYDQLVKAASDKETLLQREILQKKNAGVPPERLAEFREAFDNFDKSKSGYLTRLEFKSCLQTLEEDLSDAELDKLMAELAVDGKIGFESFAGWMSKRAADSDTQEQILDAFKTVAGDKDFVTSSDLARVLPAEKVEYLKKNMPKYQGQDDAYDYKAWAQLAFSR